MISHSKFLSQIINISKFHGSDKIANQILYK